MPPCRTTVEMRDAAMPDSCATIASASSEVSRCWASKSAGTYSASITGVIGNTLSSRTAPFQVCDSVAAVAIAGFARSVSARSSGTRMDLNICASCSIELNMAAQICPLASIVRRLPQQFRAGEAHQLAAAKCHLVPVPDRKVEDRKARGRQIVLKGFFRGGVAAAGQRQRQFMHAGIVADHHQSPGIGGLRHADDPQQLGRVGAVEFGQELDMRRWREILDSVPHRLARDLPGLL